MEKIYSNYIKVFQIVYKSITDVVAVAALSVADAVAVAVVEFSCLFIHTIVFLSLILYYGCDGRQMVVLWVE